MKTKCNNADLGVAEGGMESEWVGPGLSGWNWVGLQVRVYPGLGLGGRKEGDFTGTVHSGGCPWVWGAPSLRPSHSQDGPKAKFLP